MRKIVRIKFRPAGKLYDFDSGAFVLNKDDNVIVVTEQGLSLGIVAIPPLPYEKNLLDRPLKKVFRLANEADFKQIEKNFVTEKVSHAFCLEGIRQLELKMNLFSVKSIFDASKLTFFFTSEGRVDFQQLVKMLVKEFGVRIEMRQIGIRNKAKMCGGVGRCGRAICCSTFIGKFDPVSIRMAKEQNLSLNPTKISGICGRLMCCLNFEHETYQKLRKKFPKMGAVVNTAVGKGKVVHHHLICNRITVSLDSGSEIEIQLDKIIKE